MIALTNRIAIWPFSTPMDCSGRMADELQGIFSRGVCRAFAEGLLRTKICKAAVCLPIVTLGEVTSWAVTGREWSLDEALAMPLPEGTDFMVFGTLSIADRVELHVTLVWQSQRRLLVDQSLRFSVAWFPNCLSDIVATLASAIARRPLSAQEYRQLQRWGTNSSEAYLAYLEAWSAGTAYRLGVTVPRPQAALESARKATSVDPTFAAAQRLKEKLTLIEGGQQPDGADELDGYSEFAYPITIPRQLGKEN